MPYAFEFDWRNRVFRVRLYGRVTDKVLRDFYRAAYKINFHTQPVAALLDMSEITSLELSTATVLELAAAAPLMPLENRPRVLIAPTAASYKVARLFERHGKATRPKLHVVRTEGEALGIIGVKKPNFEPLDWM